MPRKPNKDKFLKKAKKFHGDKYDYSKVVYVNSKTHVIIGCKKHGDFLQKPTNHLNGGCTQCGLESMATSRLYTKEKFIRKAKEIHKNKYDYSKVKYKDQQKEIIIICPKHGEFNQKPFNHFYGGCKKCAIDYVNGLKRFTKEDFIEKARKIHGNKYDYSKVNYKNAHTKVKIKCPIHGWFMQQPQAHYRGQCNKCGIEQLSKTKTLTTEHFIERAKKVHGDRYDYSKANYLGGKKKILIICKKHGEFRQLVDGHCQGDNCPKCANESRRLTTSEFIEKAKQIHGNKYDYSKVEYTIAINDVNIICKEHGEFSQIPNTHLDGSGCPVCSGREVVLSNCLATLNPEVSSEWHPKKNGEKTPYQYTVSSNEVIWWKCKEGDDHEWESAINSRTQGHNCPICSGRKAVISNSLGTLKPDLASEWHPKKNGEKTAYQYTVGSNEQIWWKCKDFSHHIWRSSIVNRSKGRGCPSCSESGYDTSKDATLYINEIKLTNGKHALKYGITNRDYKDRAKSQRKHIDGSLKNIFNFRTSGVAALDTETLIARCFDNKGYLTKEEMLDGFTETVEYSEENLRKIKSIVDEVLTEKAEKKN